MRYGGLMVDASECDYSSFKQLGLLCPICSRPVFLVQAAQREAHTRKNKDGGSVAVKESSVLAHFSHFPDVSKEEVDECELRNRQITPTQRTAIAVKAKGQRLKVLQSNLWKMLKTSFRLYYAEGTEILLADLFLEVSVMNEMRSRAYLDRLVEHCALSMMHPTNLQVVKRSFEQGCKSWAALAEKYPGNDNDFLYSGFKAWPSSIIDTKMHEAICLEVLDFLSTKMQRPILNLLIKYSIYNYASATAYFLQKESKIEEVLELINTLDHSRFNYEQNRPFVLTVLRNLIGGGKDELSALFSYVRDDVLQAIYFTNWAQQFDAITK
jgi:hypothetical protein